MKAVEVLMEHGVPEERIIFINLVYNFTRASFVPFLIFSDRVSRRLDHFLRQVPPTKSCTQQLLITPPSQLSLTPLQITGWIDQGLNEKAYIIPGLGDFGERRSVLAFAVTLPFKHL